MSPEPPSDETLAGRAQGGDREARTELARRYGPIFRRFAGNLLGRVEDGEDAGQDALLRLLESVGAYDRGRPFAPWAFAIARNVCRDRLRKRREALVPPEALEERGPSDLSPEQLVGREESAERIRAAVSELSGPDQEVLWLRFRHGLSNAEIAETVGIAEGALRVRLFRALARLRERLRGKGVMEP